MNRIDLDSLVPVNDLANVVLFEHWKVGQINLNFFLEILRNEMRFEKFSTYVRGNRSKHPHDAVSQANDLDYDPDDIGALNDVHSRHLHVHLEFSLEIIRSRVQEYLSAGLNS